MKYYLAPMEGLTTYLYRRTFHKYYGSVDKYFTPFIANSSLSSRERNDILPEHNTGMEVVPQILTNRADDFLAIAKELASYGYTTVNLNLGCPSGTVVARKRGAGFLSIPEELDRFLDAIYSACPSKISIKTRIGVEDTKEWEQLLAIYAKYPLEELIIHPRLQKQGYAGMVHMDAYHAAEDRFYGPNSSDTQVSPVPLVYNGDITTTEALTRLSAECPHTDAFMIGRGLLGNPGLLGIRSTSTDSDSKPADPVSHLRAFHDELLDDYREIMSGDANTLFKMKDLWAFMGQGFADNEKYIKKIRKANRLPDYIAAVNALFRECDYIF